MNIVEKLDNTTIDITIRLTPQALNTMDEGADLLAQVEEKSPSRAAWFRHLIDTTIGSTVPSERMTPEELRDNWPATFFREPTPHKVSVRISEHQRILLRQHECFIQSLDWGRDIQRNEACLQLIDEHGQFINLGLATTLNRRNRNAR